MYFLDDRGQLARYCEDCVAGMQRARSRAKELGNPWDVGAYIVALQLGEIDVDGRPIYQPPTFDDAVDRQYQELEERARETGRLGGEHRCPVCGSAFSGRAEASACCAGAAEAMDSARFGVGEETS